MTDKMSIAIAAGGTAAMSIPRLPWQTNSPHAGHDVRFFGETRRLEGKLVPDAGFDFFPVEVTGFDRARPWTLITALAHLSREESPGAHLQANPSQARCGDWLWRLCRASFGAGSG